MKCGCASCGKVKTIWRLGYCLDCLGERCGKAEGRVREMTDLVLRLTRENAALRRQLAQMGRNP